MTSRLTLTVLADNTTLIEKDRFMGEAGLSFYLETGRKKILFDTGFSDLFLKNAGDLGIDLRACDYLVLSHGHNDHTSGLPSLARHLAGSSTTVRKPGVPVLIAHPRCFWPKFSADSMTGSPLTEAQAGAQFSLRLSAVPVWITRDLVFLGEIPRKFTFERAGLGKRRIRHPDGKTGPDALLDDSALVFRSHSGLVIITGCSHAGICTITEYAREICGEERVRDIIGGLHLLDPGPNRLEKTAAYLKSLSLEALHACHCTSLAAKIALAGSCPVRETGVGKTHSW